MNISLLPTLNAFLNATSAFLLLLGFVFIKKRKILSHKICMGGAFFTSTLFLISYLTYHFHAGHVSFKGTGWIRPVYFLILTTHTILAGLIVPLALITLFRALKGQFERHTKIARWTWPIWMYVSVTGVVIYGMVYHLNR